MQNGKGSKPRKVDSKKFNNNWDKIDWSLKKFKAESTKPKASK